jgi:hypothetical protein
MLSSYLTRHVKQFGNYVINLRRALPLITLFIWGRLPTQNFSINRPTETR